MNRNLKIATFYKHFKGKDLIEKNIYLIIAIGISKNDFNEMQPKYVGDNKDNINYSDLVIYLNYFQNQLFAREYQDLIEELTEKQQKEYSQKYRVQALDKKEVQTIMTPVYQKEKKLYLENKYGKKN